MYIFASQSPFVFFCVFSRDTNAGFWALALWSFSMKKHVYNNTFFGLIP